MIFLTKLWKGCVTYKHLTKNNLKTIRIKHSCRTHDTRDNEHTWHTCPVWTLSIMAFNMTLTIQDTHHTWRYSCMTLSIHATKYNDIKHAWPSIKDPAAYMTLSIVPLRIQDTQNTGHSAGTTLNVQDAQHIGHSACMTLSIHDTQHTWHSISQHCTENRFSLLRFIYYYAELLFRTTINKTQHSA
jgi:hypothetical protein